MDAAPVTSPPRPAGAALVLGSGGARGAYEVGVARFLFEDLHARLRQPPDITILCGTSAGALNAYGLASFADRPLVGVGFLARRWRSLDLGRVMQTDRRQVMRLLRTLLGCPPPARFTAEPPGAILDPAAFHQHVFQDLPLEVLPGHIRRGRLDALTVVATEVATGGTALFTQTATAGPPGGLRPAHALASAAIPLVFPPVRIDGRLHCDGSLRNSVPLHPALDQGATRIVVVSTQHEPGLGASLLAAQREQAAESPLYLLGKAVNALTLDRLDEDLRRLESTNQLLATGARVFGPDFQARLNAGRREQGEHELHQVSTVVVRPSESLGRMAADHVRGPGFSRRNCGAIARLFQRLVEAESEHEADLVSYLLFDGPFAGALMELGYQDARRQADALAALFAARAARTTAA